MNQPVPVSRNGVGATRCAPPVGHVSVTSDATSDMTSATAGLARSSASWTDSSAALAMPGIVRRTAKMVYLRTTRILTLGRPQKEGSRGDAPGALSVLLEPVFTSLQDGHRLD